MNLAIFHHQTERQIRSYILALTFFALIFCILPKEFPLLNKLHLKIPENLQSFNIFRKKKQVGWRMKKKMKKSVNLIEEIKFCCTFQHFLHNGSILHLLATYLLHS
jgi:hypothetical protein